MEKIIYALTVQAMGLSSYCRRRTLEQFAFERNEAWRVAWKFPPDAGKLRKFNCWGISLISLLFGAFGIILYARALVSQFSPVVATIAIAVNMLVTVSIIARCRAKNPNQDNAQRPT